MEMPDNALNRTNAASLARALAVDGKTIASYLDLLVDLLLVRRLAPWHANVRKRLVKSPKVCVRNSGLAATVTGLTAAHWDRQRERLGHLLESFVVKQRVAWAGWTDPDLRLWHDRDKDQAQVDLVITRGRQTWGVEVKHRPSL